MKLDHHPKHIFELPAFRDFTNLSMEKLIQGSQIMIRGHKVNTPDGVAYYRGCWTRDFTMLCESGHPLITPEFIREGLELFLHTMGPNGEIPDRVPSNPRKKVVYHLFGKFPFLDNPFWLIRMLTLYVDASQDIQYFIQNEDKFLAGLHSQQLLDRNHELLRIEKSHLRQDWGFTDCVKKTGYVLFSNLLKLDTLRTLSRLYHYSGKDQISREFEERFHHLQRLLIAELYDPVQSLFFSTTGMNHKIDVWGNAFGVYLGVFPPDLEEKVANALYNNRNKFVWNGHIRHLFKPETWDAFFGYTELLRMLPNTYQNGAFWGTPSGWMAYSFEKVKGGAGNALIEDLLSYYQQYGIYECVYPKMFRHSRKCNHYVASLALPMRLLKFEE